MSYICPRPAGCTEASQLAHSGFVLEEVRGGLVPEQEEKIFKHYANDSSWNTVLFAAITAITGGFLGIGGFIVDTAMGLGLDYLALNTLVNGGGINSTQDTWFGATGLNIANVGAGFANGNTECTTDICKQFRDYVNARHIHSDPPGTPTAHGDGSVQNPGNFAGTLRPVQGEAANAIIENKPYTPMCDVTVLGKECDDIKAYSGIMPRSDSWQTKAKTSRDYERNREPCIAMGKAHRELLKCMASRIPID